MSDLDAAPDLETGGAAAGGRRSHSLSVAAGVMSSRVLGLVRDRLLAHLLGVGLWRDLFDVLFRGANLLQNLLGEQALSAAFLPIYNRFREGGRPEEARRFAHAVLLIMVVTVAALVLALWLVAPWTARILVPGWADEPQRMADVVRGVRILLPMSGFLVLSAWCLAVLNSHDRFFLPYAAPVAWNVALLTALAAAWWTLASSRGDALVLARPESQRAIVLWACWGGVVGGALQLLVQLGPALREVGGRILGSWRAAGVTDFGRAFGPALMGRGVVQLSSYLDLMLGSLLAAGAIAAMGNAFRIYFLAATLVGTTIVVVELPALSRLVRPVASPDGGSRLDPTAALVRLRRSFADAAFLSLPSAVGLAVLGVPIVGTILQTGRFGRAETLLVGTVLGIYAVGLVPGISSRLLQNLFYALGDTATPARIAAGRLAVGAAIAVPSMLALDRIGVSDVFAVGDSALRLGAWGLALGSALGAWFELGALTVASRRRAVPLGLPWRRLALFASLSIVAAASGGAAWWVLRSLPPLVLGPLVVAAFAAVYLVLARFLGVPELATVVERWNPLRRGHRS
ncbi:MAG: murein biosynthesis integral membrane protein MurJ [Acidobacteria bacterium]|nr:MAG: murein biosynthesis integral membrane protein MurJ [Acidobacteriota bacterium]REK00105.1 MAG: murein biosynthesis integral membrane protein MurJ [Acidobacteriota bacterium]